MRQQPYKTVLKPYGRALLDLARECEEILCLSGDLTRQCEIDLFEHALPERFIHAGMAEANMLSMAGSLARKGYVPFVHTFGVFATRRPLDQIVNSIAYPDLPVKIVGFMPGVSSPGGPSHQAIEDVALMRALPNMTVVDIADAVEVRAALPVIASSPGPVYLRMKRGEVPLIFEEDYEFSLERAYPITFGTDVAIFANGMMLPAALAAERVLSGYGLSARVINVPVVKPLDRRQVIESVRATRVSITAENHSIVGGLGSAVAEVIAEEGIGRPLRRIGLRDTFAEGSRSAPPLFTKYGISTQDLVNAAWEAAGCEDLAPEVRAGAPMEGEYAPV